jgi:hypothetical protein
LLAQQHKVLTAQVHYAGHRQGVCTGEQGGVDPQPGSGADAHQIGGGKTVGGSFHFEHILWKELPGLSSPAQLVQAIQTALVRLRFTSC